MSFFVSKPVNSAPEQFQTPSQQRIYELLAELHIPFSRVDTDDGSTMEDCEFISQGLGCPVVKTIFLCNRQQTRFYLYVTAGDKPFVTRDFCGSLGISRVSFAPTDLLWEKLGTRIGATTALSLFNDPSGTITLVLDRAIVSRPMYACTDGTTTCFLKLPTADLLEKYLTHIGHSPQVID